MAMYFQIIHSFFSLLFLKLIILLTVMGDGSLCQHTIGEIQVTPGAGLPWRLQISVSSDILPTLLCCFCIF